ncbi:predicted protein [Lichtheimia corymbifera JMRC:FSU:9682]|uniref:Uncharacterized protein n=1 Tax=Lichtheimia corymbifera JMRC:FSU:9682 TaxID=1263082 RepID=A0A068RXE8_9FUNG|nr:predicted protein [Lichtheimia corymbifera JMRC:FSU:9682]
MGGCNVGLTMEDRNSAPVQMHEMSVTLNYLGIPHLELETWLHYENFKWERPTKNGHEHKYGVRPTSPILPISILQLSHKVLLNMLIKFVLIKIPRFI